MNLIAPHEGQKFGMPRDVAGKPLSVRHAVLHRKGHDPASAERSLLLHRHPARFDAAKERRIGEILGYPPKAIDHCLVSCPFDPQPTTDAPSGHKQPEQANDQSPAV